MPTTLDRLSGEGYRVRNLGRGIVGATFAGVVSALLGIGGGIISVAAGKGCLATFAPPLDAAGNSVRGRLVAGYLARALGLDMLASAPDPTHTGSVS